jgi:hypothetical protein
MKHYFCLCTGQPREDHNSTGTYTIDIDTDGEHARVFCAYTTVYCFPENLRDFGEWLIAVADSAAVVGWRGYRVSSDEWLP